MGLLVSFAVVAGAIQAKEWDAKWIGYPGSNGSDYEVLHFRNTLELEAVPESLTVDLSGDTRYRFFVNGKAACFGPASSDPAHWNHETVNIAPFLQQGTNVLAALVFNFGELRPFCQMSHRTGFILRSSNPALNTGTGEWRVMRNEAYSPNNPSDLPHGMFGAVGTGDRVDGARYPWGWETIGFDDSGWPAPQESGVGGELDRFLVPRDIPLLEEKRESISVVRRTAGLPKTNRPGFPLEIPADTKVSILLDMEQLTVGYPELRLSKGAGSVVQATYAEALFIDHEKFEKGHRNKIEGKHIHGYSDVFEHDGGDNRLYRPLWNRTFRYIQLDIETKQEPLVINGYSNIFTAYPFEENATFKSSDKSLERIWNTGWRTARLCAMETYMDCPYYEQLQYIGDTRIQALVSLYVSGDDRLMRRALRQFDHSRLPSGLTQSRYPTGCEQVIPTFSLVWISMIHDYYMHRRDDEFLRDFLPGIRGVLDYFESKQSPENPLDIRPGWWCFVDWAKSFDKGRPQGHADGTSSIIALQYINALQKATELFELFGKVRQAEEYRKSADTLKEAVIGKCFDSERGLLAQTPEKNIFSQHANILGVLTDTIPQGMQKEVMEKVVDDSSLVQATIYFRFYLFQALDKVGLGDRYLEMLGPWHEAIAKGLTTFPEAPGSFERSDCHAWSASPNHDLLATVCGIRPATPGFETVAIRPNLGDLDFVSCKMPHPKGEIVVELRKNENGIAGTVELPKAASGSFMWKGRQAGLLEGLNKIAIKRPK